MIDPDYREDEYFTDEEEDFNYRGCGCMLFAAVAIFAAAIITLFILILI